MKAKKAKTNYNKLKNLYRDFGLSVPITQSEKSHVYILNS